MYSQKIERGKIEIVEIGLKTNNNQVRLLSYIIINNNIYTGVVLDGDFGNFVYNKISPEFENMIYNSISIRWSDNKVRKKTKFKKLKDIYKTDRIFLWRCFEISSEYLILPMKIEKNDFFCFIYNKNRCVVGFKDIPFEKVKRCKNLPLIFLNEVLKNKNCID